MIPMPDGEDAQATILEVSEVETQGMKGYLVTYDIENYGVAQPYFYKLSANWSGERTERSWMPYTKNLEAFDWSKYRADIGPVKAIAEAFVSLYMEFRTDGRGLYIYSETKGSGKTYLACCLAKSVIDRYNAMVRFVTAADYIDWVRDKDPRLEETRECGLLILDDIGVQSDKQEWVAESIFRLVDNRYRKKLSTIYTSNLRFDKASGNDRTFSRIYSASVPIKLPEEGIRDRIADTYRDEFLDHILAGVK